MPTSDPRSQQLPTEHRELEWLSEPPLRPHRSQDFDVRLVVGLLLFSGAAGGLCSTVDDLLTWQRALVTGDVVGAESYERMTTPASLASGERMTYGYGLDIGELERYRQPTPGPAHALAPSVSFG